MLEHSIIEELINFYNHSFTIIDKHEKVIYWSDRASEIFNMEKSEVIGKDIKEIFAEDKLAILQTLRNNEVIEKKQHMATKSIYVNLKSVPIIIEGKVEGAIVSEIDVTEQKRQEEEIEQLKNQVSFLTDNVKQLKNEEHFKNIIFKSSIMENLKNQIKRAAKTNANILITGETGVGKELFAQSIHNSSETSGEFIPINCGAIPKHLFEAELFGYEKGAFTGANKEGNKGKLELAKDGTLFLDEIGDMPLDMQVKFLRVLQERKYFRLGGKKEVSTHFRLVSATNKSISELLNSDDFRSDLLYRINVLNIHIPPLRERPDDIESLFYYYLYHLSKKYQTELRYADHSLLNNLRSYHWPGNVRELINVAERLVIFSNEDQLNNNIFDQYLVEVGQSDKTLSVPNLSENLNLKDYIHKVEAEYIKYIVDQNDHNIEKSSHDLGISRPTLYSKMRKFQF
ncbi:sigma-54-dependent Fis family transcriptional regulator [Oceanobacillus oncorhynchi subsp. incaldanensis]|uniref:Limonene hydroxylase n=1 Tax=Oceanobacillus oncorhynchi TaxID=545501 RepID=A0A0A1MFH0_9BACI|nr:sigma 54-interacting transcriptional regulator [Oceanobacillus oncorhynchi]GIO20658.1 sigma-54-dependent Fis family transcriptional regulator [Oceanobacillus oncorhynchi subsp. incaldanensis]CEI81798.1 Limonene hydroxylase [Oceanobacillus oncorhynchi]